MSVLTLKIGGQIYTGWKRIAVETGIEQLAGRFDLACADRWVLQGQPLPMPPGSACELAIDNTVVIAGWLDDAEPEYSVSSHELRLCGRDATGDLVDCAARVDGQGWLGSTLEKMARDLCKPFGITVTVDAGVKKAAQLAFRQPRVNPGETGFETLSRAAQLRGCLLVSDANGGLRITAAGAQRARTSLQRGVNLLGGSALHSQAERFHDYRVYGQTNENNGQTGAQAQQVLAVATDPAIRRGRATDIHVSEDIDRAEAKRLAEWTAANRLARGVCARLTVRGWLDGSAPWRINHLVKVQDDLLRLDGEFLIASTCFTLDEEGGEITRLRVTPPQAYTPAPLSEKIGLGAEDFS